MTEPTEIIQPGVGIIFSDHESVLNSLDEKLVVNFPRPEERFYNVIFTVLTSTNGNYLKEQLLQIHSLF